MANHHSQVDVILGTKTDIDKLYNLLKDMPDSFDYSGTMMKAFPGEVGYFDANRITYGTAAKKSVEFKDLYFLSSCLSDCICRVVFLHLKHLLYEFNLNSDI